MPGLRRFHVQLFPCQKRTNCNEFPENLKSRSFKSKYLIILSLFLQKARAHTYSLAAAQSCVLKNMESTNRCRLLRLPPELRNRIYSLAIIEQDPIKIPLTIIEPSGPSVSEPALLAVNREVRAETLAIFWGANTFISGSMWMAYHFLNRLSSDKVSRLRNIRVCFDIPSEAGAHRDWVLDHISGITSKIEWRHRDEGLREDAISVIVTSGIENGGLVWKSLTEIEGLKIVDDDLRWSPELKSHVDGNMAGLLEQDLHGE